MSRLFRITLRWLKRDKKRTLLTTVSIILAVYVITFVGVYFSSAVSGARSLKEYQNGNYHSEVYCENYEQASRISKNAAVESSSVAVENNNLFYDRFVENYGRKSMGGDNDYFLDLKINGIDVPSKMQCEDIKALAVDGDFFSLYKESETLSLEGSLPAQSGEVALNSYFASLFGTDIGDTLTVTYNVKTGKLYYTDYDNADEITGEAPTVTDTDGSVMNGVYGELMEEADVDSFGRGSYSAFCQTIDFFNSSDKEANGQYFSEISDNTVESFTYTATVVGIYQGREDYMIFSYSDSEIMPYIENSLYGSSRIYLRIKKGCDAVSATVNATKEAGVQAAAVGENIIINPVQLMLEGRNFEYLNEVGTVIIAVIVIIGLFVFLARLIINNAFEIFASYRTEQYGALKTVGASDGQLFAMVMFECFLYSVVALPVGVILAVISGRAVIGKVVSYKIFDGVYGDGVTARFLNLDMNPYILGAVIFIALFSIFFSAYADAMRVKRMPPIKSASYGKGKSKKKKHSKWLSRRFFGFEFGFAVKAVSRQKVRFAVTILATVMSGILIVAVTEIVDVYSSTLTYADPHTYDLELWVDNLNSMKSTGTLEETYSQLEESGYFSEVSINGSDLLINCGGEYADEDFYKSFTEEYRQLSDSMLYSETLAVRPITRQGFEKLNTDVTYDELLKSKKVLMSRYIYADKSESEEYSDGSDHTLTAECEIWVDDSPRTVSYTDDVVSEDGESTQTVTAVIESAGTYTTEDYNYVQTGCATAVVPIENFAEFFDSLPQNKLNGLTIENGYDGYNFLLNVSGDTTEAKEYLVNTFRYCGGITDNTRDTKVRNNLTNAIKAAGFSLAGVLLAVAALNIVCTVSGEMINRRKEFSMLRSCGMSLRQIFMSLTYEGLFVSVISAAVSAVAGGMAAKLVLEAFLELSSSPVPVLSTLAVFAIVQLLMTLSITAPLMKISSSSVAEDIRTE